jgi:hypothetical protein
MSFIFTPRLKLNPRLKKSGIFMNVAKDGDTAMSAVKFLTSLYFHFHKDLIVRGIGVVLSLQFEPITNRYEIKHYKQRPKGHVSPMVRK